MPYRKLFFYTFAESRKQIALSPPFSLGTPDLVPTHLTSPPFLPSHATRLIKRHKCGFQNVSVPDTKRGVRSRIACFFFSPSLFLHFFFFLFSLHFFKFSLRSVPLSEGGVLLGSWRAARQYDRVLRRRMEDLR